MTALTIEQLYQQYIKPIPISEQFRLIALIGQQLAIQSASIDKKQRSLLELEGLGTEIWKDIDAQEYVDNLRQEWDKH